MRFSANRIRSTIQLLLVTGVAATAAYAADPVLGTWKLDVSHSKFSSEPAPRSEMRMYKQTADGVQVTVKRVDSKGKESTTEYPTTFDGKDHIQPGTSPDSSVVLKRDNDYHASAVLKHAGIIMADVERSISEDGTTMTITYKGKNDTGDPIDNSLVYQKVTTTQSR